MASKAPKEDPILHRLDTIIRLQAQIALTSIREPKDKVLFLSGVGLGPKAVAEMLGMSPNAVSSVLKRARKAAAAEDDESDGERA
jgi:DNA-directed RNA polymerase specialized sigma24 family protein